LYFSYLSVCCRWYKGFEGPTRTSLDAPGRDSVCHSERTSNGNHRAIIRAELRAGIEDLSVESSSQFCPQQDVGTDATGNHDAVASLLSGSAKGPGNQRVDRGPLK
jgi:hypothetical protein